MFKNLQLFRLTEAVTIDEDRLAALPFRDCATYEREFQGWHEPVAGEGFTREVALGNTRFTLLEHARQEKLMPASVVNELVDKEVAARGGAVSCKDRAQIKERVIERLLPTALAKTSRTWVVTDGDWVWVACSSLNKAEEILSFLRETLGTLPAVPVQLAAPVPASLTRWVAEAEAPAPFLLAEACEMRHPSDRAQVSRFAGADLTVEEIRNHLDAGMQVTRLQLVWEDRLLFTVDENLGLRGIRYLEGALEAADEIEDASLRLDADARLACAEIAALIPVLYDALGGGAADGVDDGVEFGLTGS